MQNILCTYLIMDDIMSMFVIALDDFCLQLESKYSSRGDGGSNV